MLDRVIIVDADTQKGSLLKETLESKYSVAVIKDIEVQQCDFIGASAVIIRFTDNFPDEYKQFFQLINTGIIDSVPVLLITDSMKEVTELPKFNIYDIVTMPCDEAIFKNRLSNLIKLGSCLSDEVSGDKLLLSSEKLTKEKLSETDKQLQFLNMTAHDLLAQPDSNKGIEQVLNKIMNYYGGNRVYIFEFDYIKNQSSNTYEVCAQGVQSAKDTLQNIPLEIMSFWVNAFSKKNYISIEDVDSLDDSRAVERNALLEQEIKSLVAVPLWRNGVLIGFIGVDDPSRRQSLADRLDAIGDYIAVMLTRRDSDAKIKSDTAALHNLMDDTPGGFARIKLLPDGSFVLDYINKVLCELIGTTVRKAMNEKNPVDAIHPDDFTAILKTIDEMKHTGKSFRTKIRLRHSSGDFLWLLVFARVTRNESGEVFINTYYADLSESEKREISFRETLPVILKTIMESSTDLAFAKDSRFAYICCSGAFARMAGKTCEAEVIGKTDYDLFEKTVADKFRFDDMRLVTEKKSIVDMIESIPSNDGITHYSNTSKYLLRDTNGNIVGFYGVGRDITEYRTAFEQPKFLTNSIPGGLVKYKITRDSISTLYLSNGVCALSGYTKKEYMELTSRDITALILDEDRSVVNEQLAAMRDGGKAVDCTFRIHTKNGDLRWVNLRGTIAEKCIDGIISHNVMFDVTNAKLAEEELRRNQENMQLSNQLVDDSSASVYVCDAHNYEMLYVNTKCALMCGKSVNDFKGQTCYKFLKGLDKPCEPCYMNFSNDKEYTEREYTSDVSEKHYLTRGKFIDWGGRRALVEYLSDETERINTQRSLRSLVDGIPSGIGIYNFYDDGRVELVYLNDGYYSIIGSTREERNIYGGFSVMSAVHPDDKQRVISDLEYCLKNNTVPNVDLRVKCADGNYKWINVKAKVAYRVDDKTILYSSYSDIDKEKRSRLQLEASQRVLDFANKEGRITLWLYDLDKKLITHELKNGTVFEFRPVFDEPQGYFITSGTVYSEDTVLFREMYERLHNGEERSECTVRIINSLTGQSGWQHIVYTRLHDTYYRGHIAVGISADVDVQQETLLHYEHELMLRQEMVKDSFIYYEINLSTGVIEEFSTKADDIPSMQVNRVIDKNTHEEILTRIAPEDREAVRSTLLSDALFEAFKNRKTSVSLEYRRLVPNVGKRWMRANVTMMKRPGSDDVIAFLHSKDIDDEMKASLAIQSIMNEEIETIVVVKVKSGIARYVNKNEVANGFVENNCFKFAKTMKQRIDATVFIEDRQACLDFFNLENLAESLKNSPSSMLVYRVNSYSSSVMRKRTLAFYLDETHEDIVLFRRDITQLYEEEQRQKRNLQKAVQMANEANRAKSEFLSRMSHDMRTPMNAVIGMVNLAKSEKNSPQTAEYLENIDSSSHFLLGLINDVLDLGKIESGKIDLREEPFTMEEFTRSINTVIRPMMDAKNMTFDYRADCGISGFVADKLRFTQIFFNLLSNSVKYTKEGGRIEFTAERIDDRDGKCGIRYCVRDNGMGMSEKFLKILFDPFSQEHSNLNSEAKGSGLGLAIVKNLIETMGGTISVKSKLGIGTEFTVVLYLKVETENDRKMRATKKEHIRLDGLRVLLVEDNKMNIMVAQKMLELKGCIVTVAMNGLEAVNMFDASEIDYYNVILMDIRMPVMSGTEATKIIRSKERADAKTVKIIAMTADAFAKDEQISLDAGMDKHISKPIEPQILFKALSEYMPDQSIE